MKRVMTFVIALMIASVAFGQKKTTRNPLVSEQNYKHPFAAASAKENNIGATEKYSTSTTIDAQDYKHGKSRKEVRRVNVPQGSGANSAASTKHPFN